VYVSVLEIHRSTNYNKAFFSARRRGTKRFNFFRILTEKERKEQQICWSVVPELTQLLFSIYNLTQHKMDEAEHNYFVPLIESRCEVSAGRDDDRWNTILHPFFGRDGRETSSP
jgi:hypothetical protein